MAPIFYDALFVRGQWVVVNAETGTLIYKIDHLGAPLTEKSALNLARSLNATRLATSKQRQAQPLT